MFHFKIPSGSELLINSTGSFKRFDSIDRDYKPFNQATINSPSWSIAVPDIPPQPLRPAPPLSPKSPKSPKQRKSPTERWSPKEKSTKQQR